MNYMQTEKENIRNYNVGNSNYSKHAIQPWDIWEEYDLNPWDADIVKRVLRTKEEPGMSFEEARIMDYEKIIHICKKRIDMLNNSDYDRRFVSKMRNCIIMKNTEEKETEATICDKEPNAVVKDTGEKEKKNSVVYKIRETTYGYDCFGKSEKYTEILKGVEFDNEADAIEMANKMTAESQEADYDVITVNKD